MSTTDTANRRLCHALFDAIEGGDLVEVGRCLAPDVTMWFNVTGQESTRDDILAALAHGYRIQRRRTYDDRLVSTFDGGFVVQYTLGVVLNDGSRTALSACLVAEVRDEQVSRMWEYLDSGRFAARRPAGAPAR